MALELDEIDLFLREAAEIVASLDRTAVARVLEELVAVRSRGGRVFVVGSGGGAAHASHFVADLRKLAGVEAYSPTDNVAELTARVNDEGWEGSYREWLVGSRLGRRDLLFVFSVGGGDPERGVSANLVRCVEHAREVGARVCGVVGRDGGFTARVADACVVVPALASARVTAHTEGVQAVVWHLLVTHSALAVAQGRWESLVDG